MAYRLPSPKFKVQNLLNRTKTYGSARKITWNKVGRADKYNIYRSYIPYGKFTRLATVSGDTTEYIDETVGIISNNDFSSPFLYSIIFSNILLSIFPLLYIINKHTFCL